jgi:ferritin
MLSEALQILINEQITHELFSSNLYLAMAAYFEAKSLPGFAVWMRAQAEEERGHALKFFEFVTDRGGRAKISQIPAPAFEWTSALDAFEHVLQHEQKVTSLVNTLYEASLKEKDYPAQILLQWFITEQVEEEKNAALVVDQLKMMEDRQGGMINFDHHMGKRSE